MLHLNAFVGCALRFGRSAVLLRLSGRGLYSIQAIFTTCSHYSNCCFMCLSCTPKDKLCLVACLFRHAAFSRPLVFFAVSWPLLCGPENHLLIQWASECCSSFVLHIPSASPLFIGVFAFTGVVSVNLIVRGTAILLRLFRSKVIFALYLFVRKYSISHYFRPPLQCSCLISFALSLLP